MNKTPEQLTALQHALEDYSLSAAAARYDKALAERGLGNSRAGKALFSQFVAPFAAEIASYIEDAKAGRATAAARAWVAVAELDPEIIAFYVLRLAFDNFGRTRASLAAKVGKHIADELNAAILVKADVRKRLLKSGVFKKTLLTANTKRAIRAMQDIVDPEKLLDVQNHGFDLEMRALLGLVLLKLLESSGLNLICFKAEAKGKHTVPVIYPTLELIEFLKSAGEAVIASTPVFSPMVVPPRDWTGPENGAYLKSNTEFIRRGYIAPIQTQTDSGELTRVFAAVNSVQSVPYSINTDLVALGRAILETGGQLGGLPDTTIKTPPTFPVDFDAIKINEPERAAALVAFAESCYDHNTDVARLTQCQKAWNTVYAAEEFAEFDKIYLPCQLDFRGRLYYLPRILNPQSEDFTRSLFRFSTGVALGKTGLAALKRHAANCFGHGEDKAGYASREAWATTNIERMKKSVENPLDFLFWTQAEKPFMFLAAAQELVAALASPNPHNYVSHLPVPVDGSCNGIQHWAALMRCKTTAASVNLMPGAKPADIYSEVLMELVRVLTEMGTPESLALAKQVNRKSVKKAVMTLPYGLTAFGLRQYITSENPHIFGRPFHKPTIDLLLDATTKAIGNSVRACKQGMVQVQALARNVAKRGEPLIFTLPDGFQVINAYPKHVTVEVRTYFAGKTRYREDALGSFSKSRLSTSIKKPVKDLDVTQNATAAPPNVIHALDACHLRLTVLALKAKGVTDFLAIHDSFATHAGNVETLADTLRECFVQLHKTDWLLALFAENKSADVPELIGGLDIEQVLSSPYFFH